MSGLLYRAHRSQTFDALIGQDHVVAVLQEALKQDRVAHAYLFSGPRGVGKTSVARLLAKAVNCQERGAHGTDACDTCEPCCAIREGRALDVIELDAASNRGIDDMRELRERVRMAPAQLTKRLVIIDEVHMLTREAFQAVLKTLEEPPEHTLFALATTEPHKVPVTIRSRCQQFAFSLVRADVLQAHLQDIARKESIEVHDDALALIVRGAEGSVRDALSLLSQVATLGETITKELVQHTFGWADQAAIRAVCADMVAQKGTHALVQVQELMMRGTDASMLLDACIEQLRAWLLAAAGAIHEESLPEHASVARIRLVLIRLMEARQLSSNAQVALELALLHEDVLGSSLVLSGTTSDNTSDSISDRTSDSTSDTISDTTSDSTSTPHADMKHASATTSTHEKTKQSGKEGTVEPSVTATVQTEASVSLADVRSAWSGMRAAIAKISPMLSVGFNQLMPVAVKEGSPCTVTIAGTFGIHVQRWQQADAQSILKQMSTEYLGTTVAWSVCELNALDPERAKAAQAWHEQMQHQEQQAHAQQEQDASAVQRRPVFGATAPAVEPAPRTA